MIKHIAKATSLIALILFATGCTFYKVASVNVKEGTTQYPSEIKPLIFVNFSTVSDLYFSDAFTTNYGKLPWRVLAVWIENEKTHERTVFILDQDMSVSGAMKAPCKVDSNTVYTSAFITLPPGDYVFNGFRIELAISSKYLRPASSIDLRKEPLRFAVPDKDFCSLGAVSVEIKPAQEYADFHNLFLLPFKVHTSLRSISPPEKEFAVESYPFLKNLNLTP